MRLLNQGASIQELYNYVRQLEQEIRCLRVVGDNKTTSVTQTNAGQVVHAISQRGGGGSFGSGGARYDGPFAVGYEFNTNTRMMKLNVNFMYANVYTTGNAGIFHYGTKDMLEFNIDEVFHQWSAAGIFVQVCAANLTSGGDVDPKVIPDVSSRTSWWINVTSSTSRYYDYIYTKDIAFIKMSGNPIMPTSVSQWWQGGDIHVEGRII